MDALLIQARSAVRDYLSATEQEPEPDLASFCRVYRVASDACAVAGLSLAQQMVEQIRALAIRNDDLDEIPPLPGPFKFEPKGGLR